MLTFEYEVQWVVPLLPLTLIPQSHWERDAIALFPRLFITCMAVTQFLGAFPVAGSQKGIAAIPMILWAYLCIVDGIAGLRAASKQRLPDSGVRLRLDAVIGGVILLVFGGVSIALFLPSRLPPRSAELRGATSLRLPEERESEFASIARKISPNCSILFTMPGMGSFNLWSGVHTPNGWNLTAWAKGFDAERQAEILSIMKSKSDACAILNRRIARLWDKDGATGAALPLGQYIMIEMPKMAEFGEYEIRVHPQRRTPWL